jgi:hypothetical protein
MTDREFLQLLSQVLQQNAGLDMNQLSLRWAEIARAVNTHLQTPAWKPLVDADIEEVWADESKGRYATSYALEARLKSKNV